MRFRFLLFLSVVFLGLGQVWGQTVINFDNNSNWSNTSLGSYGNHTYSENNFTVALTNALRNGTANQDGFPGALGTYSIRLRDQASTQALFTIETGGVGEFSFQVRRWDGSPIPNYSVEYSIDSNTWISVSAIGATLLTDSNWKMYGPIEINSSNSNIQIRIKNPGATERIMIDNFSWTEYTSSPCDEGTLTAGTTIADPTSVNSGGSTDLSLSGASTGTELSYQWQSSSDGINWSNISGATAPTYSATNITSDTYYRANLTCGATTVSSAPVLVEVSYCIPDPLPTTDEYISNVTIGNDINNNTLGSQYTFYTSPIANLTIGEPTPISITISDGYTSDNVFLFIDWNQDMDWDDSEEIIPLNYNTNSGIFTATGSIIPPVGASLGNTRLRVKLIYGSSNDPCSSGTWGEIEDYQVNVMPACTPPADPVGSISGDTETCATASLTYSGSDIANAYWQTSPTGVSTSLPAATPYAVPTAPGTYTVYVRIHDGTCWSVNVVEHTIEVFAEPVILTQPSNISITVGNTATFTASITGATSYQWYLSTNGGANWSTITGETSDTYTTPTATLSMNGYQYRVAAFNDCGEITSSNALLTVMEGPCVEESFGNIPSANSSSYMDRSWTGDNGFEWSATSIRTDQVLDGKAITFGKASSGPNPPYSLLSPTLTDGIGKLKFSYKRAFTGTGARTLQVYVNGSKIGDDIIVNATSDITQHYEYNINISGNFILEIRSITNNQVIIDNISWTCYTDPCEAPEITLSPISGPTGTVVTITGTDFSETTGVNFDGIAATVTYIDATTLEAVVPEGATTGIVTVDTDLDCDSEAVFTVITEDLSDCEGAVNIPGIPVGQGGLVFYELFDKEVANSGLLVILNASYSNIDLNDYQIARSSNGTGSDEVSDWHVFNPVILAPGEVYVLGTGNTSLCDYPDFDGQTPIDTGINENDRIRILRKSNLSIVDEVRTPNYAGYYMKRNSGAALLPNLTHNAGDWTTTSISGTDCRSGMAVSPIASGNPDFPTISNFQLDYLDCETTSISVTAAPGDTAHTLTYQWYVNTPETTGWTLITNDVPYSGANTATLTISSASGIDRNQYYVRVMEGDANCFVPSNAVQIRKANIWDGSTWSNGSPESANMQIIFAEDYDSSTDLYPTGGIFGCSIEVKDGVNVFIASEHNVIIDNEIKVATGASFTLKDGANLVQINDDAVNEGEITAEKTFTFSAEREQYNFVISPVVGQNIKELFENNNYKAQWYNEATNYFIFFEGEYDELGGAGIGQAIQENQEDGNVQTATYFGEPHNGIIKVDGLSNGYSRYHLAGNPYPSQLDLMKFYNENSSNIDSDFRFWDNRGNTQITQQGSGYQGSNYAIFNAASSPDGTGTAAPGATDSLRVPTKDVAVGNAFLLRLLAGPAETSYTFNNAQRAIGQGQNFLGRNTTEGNASSSVDRYWLTMHTPGQISVMNAVVYFEGGNDAFAKDDSKITGGSDDIYSIVEEHKLKIQGKSSFEISDTIALGYKAFHAGTHSINLYQSEGVFTEGVNILLIDKVLEITQNLSAEGSYSFTTEAGEFQERFIIVYEEQGTEEPEEPEEPDEPLANVEIEKGGLIVYKHGNQTVISSDQVDLLQLEVFNLQGQKLMNRDKIHAKTYRLDNERLGKQALLLVVTTADGKEHSFKILTQ